MFGFKAGLGFWNLDLGESGVYGVARHHLLLPRQIFKPQCYTLPVGSYPTPFLGYLLFYTTNPNHKTRYPRKGVGYEPLVKA